MTLRVKGNGPVCIILYYFPVDFLFEAENISRHKCRCYAEYRQLLRERRQFECWDGDGKRKGAWRMWRKRERLECCVCKRLDGRGTQRNSCGGCKLLRSDTNVQEWNGVGIVISTELKEDLISVSRKSDPVMSIELGLEEMVVNIMCAYAP